MNWTSILKVGFQLAYAFWESVKHKNDQQKLLDNPLRVFLSHAVEDKPAVRRLNVQLKEQQGIRPWLDENDLVPGHDWDTVIQKSLTDAQVAIICLSPSAIHKLGMPSYFRREVEIILERARLVDEREGFIIPAKLEPCEVPPQIARWQTTSLYEIDGYQKLLKLLVEKTKTINAIESNRIHALFNLRFPVVLPRGHRL